MKFGDKLISLRKKNGLSQEELAVKLYVSRQSVSKWESNNTYPETDKIVSICNIFNCSMDDLINENISEVGEISKTNNNEKLTNSIDSLLNFISRTVDMASHMTFLSGLICIIALLIILGLLALAGNIAISVFTGIIYNACNFIEGFYIIKIFKSILGLYGLYYQS